MSPQASAGYAFSLHFWMNPIWSSEKQSLPQSRVGADVKTLADLTGFTVNNEDAASSNLLRRVYDDLGAGKANILNHMSGWKVYLALIEALRLVFFFHSVVFFSTSRHYHFRRCCSKINPAISAPKPSSRITPIPATNEIKALFVCAISGQS